MLIIRYERPCDTVRRLQGLLPPKFMRLTGATFALAAPALNGYDFFTRGKSLHVSGSFSAHARLWLKVDRWS